MHAGLDENYCPERLSLSSGHHEPKYVCWCAYLKCSNAVKQSFNPNSWYQADFISPRCMIHQNQSLLAWYRARLLLLPSPTRWNRAPQPSCRLKPQFQCRHFCLMSVSTTVKSTECPQLTLASSSEKLGHLEARHFWLHHLVDHCEFLCLHYRRSVSPISKEKKGGRGAGWISSNLLSRILSSIESETIRRLKWVSLCCPMR